MALPCYLAGTGPEVEAISARNLPAAWLSCHFGGSGLANLPPSLPGGSLILVDDSVLPEDQDPEEIRFQLEALDGVGGVILDFQRPDCPASAAMAAYLSRSLPWPTAVTGLYAHSLSCPVFLPPAPLDRPLASYLAPWKGREIWMEAAMQCQELVLDASGLTRQDKPFPQPDQPYQEEPALFCGYQILSGADSIRFTLFDTPALFVQKCRQAEALGVRKLVGLYQQLGAFRV